MNTVVCKSNTKCYTLAITPQIKMLLLFLHGAFAQMHEHTIRHLPMIRCESYARGHHYSPQPVDRAEAAVTKARLSCPLMWTFISFVSSCNSQRAHVDWSLHPADPVAPSAQSEGTGRRRAAQQEDVPIHGVLWVLDQLVERTIIAHRRAHAALRAMTSHTASQTAHVHAAGTVADIMTQA